MSKFSNSKVSTRTPKVKASAGPLKTKTKSLPTHEGGAGFAKGSKTALYTLAITNMVGEPTFYEAGKDRDERFVKLVHKVAVKDPEWIANFVPFLRDTCNMRSAAVVVAAEAAAALVSARKAGAEVNISIRKLISDACVRADEPAEVLGYWLSRYGRQMPMSVKRGIGDAATRLYNEYSVMKYDGSSNGVRMGDVLGLVHPRPRDEAQAALFTYVIERRYGRVGDVPSALSKINASRALYAVPAGKRLALLRERGADLFTEAGSTWEDVSGWVPSGMTAEAWEAIIPNMGYMALLRNLRNFEQAGVNREVLKTVRDKIADPEEVARSRQLPYRFWSAFNATNSSFFASALEDALEASTANVPEFSGRTLVAIDTSGSMANSAPSARSQVRMDQIAALFGSCVAARGDVTTIIYGNDWVKVPTQPSVLSTVAEISRLNGRVGHGTATWPSVTQAIAKHGPFDRVCVFTDMQDHPDPSVRATWSYGVDHRSKIPAETKVYVWDLMGYGSSNIDTKTPGRYLLGGFSDASFKLVPLLEAGEEASWPWE